MRKAKSTSSIPVVLTVPLSSLVPRYADRAVNPNKMEPEKFELLVEAIKGEGFLQPILVVQYDKDRWRIEDGHHRYWAAKQAGLAEVTAVVKPVAVDARAVLLGIGMNRLRGELDLGIAADLISEVQQVLTIDLSEVSMLTGFTLEELDALLKVAPMGEDILNGAAEDIHALEEATKPDKAYTLEIPFKLRDHYKLCKRKLKKMGNGDLGVGLLAALGEEVGYDEDVE